MKTRWLLLTLVVATLITTSGSQQRTANENRPINISYCEMLKSPAEYDGKFVSVDAVYDYGIEWDELLCMECRSAGRTSLEFSTEMDKQEVKKLRRILKDHGAVMGTFTGIFHNQSVNSTPYSYKFEFELQSAKISKILIKPKDWKTRITDVGYCHRNADSRPF